ncbi:MAG: DUF3014 domain-containing protein [Myxococcota bacterium]|nr:DUF3014 domain-containing protein [Myxococcota bacterium]
MADTLNVYREGTDHLKPPSSGGGGKVILMIIGLCLFLGGLGYWYLGGEEEAPAPAVVDAGTPAPPPKPTLPSPSETDPRVRSLLGPASTEANWAEYLKQSDLVRVFVSATNNIAEGESPRTRLFFLRPVGEFQTTEKADRRKKTRKLFIAPASYARYDGVTLVIGSLDEKVIASAYVALKPWIDLAFEEIAPRNARFETIWQNAINRLVAVPLPVGEVEVVPQGALFAFADPATEALSAAEKHLLRMGPTNQKVIQAKLVAISEAITAASSAGADGGTMATDGGAMGDAGATAEPQTTGDAGAM